MPHINKQMASFFLTTKCNLRCGYCYNRKRRAQLNEQSLPLHIAKAGIDYFFESNPSRHIRFYGPGEPTQELSLMSSIMMYAIEKSGEAVSAELQTNGCFGENVREWLLDNMNIVWVSFDGEPDIQNANRPFANGKPSASIIEKNVKWLIANTGNRNLMVGARITITDANANRQKEMVDYLAGLGIRYMWTDPVFPSVDSIPVCDDSVKLKEYKFNMDAYVDEYIRAYRYANEEGIFYGSFLTCNFDGECDKHCRACTPVPHFTTDGYISACDLVTFGKNAGHMDCFVYGKWNDIKESFDIDYDKVKLLQNRSINSMTHCNGCKIRKHCGGYCLGEVQNETGSLIGQKPTACKAIRRLAESIGFTNSSYPFLHP